MKPEEICDLVLKECRGEGATDAVVMVNQITVSKNLN
jgi:hypothetical protein